MSCCIPIKGGTVAPPPTVQQRFYTATNYDANFGDYRVQNISGTGAFRFTFDVPDNFVSLVSLVMRCIAQADVVDESIELFSDYGTPGELFDANSEDDTTSLFSFTEDEIAELDISSVFTNLAAGQSCGVFIDHKGIGTSIKYLGVRMVYVGT